MKKLLLIPLIISVFSVNSISASAKSEKYTYCVRETLSVLDAGKEFTKSLDIFTFWYESLSAVDSCVDSSLKDMEDRDKQYQEKVDAITAKFLDFNNFLQQQEINAARLYQYGFIKANIASNPMAKNRKEFLTNLANRDLSFTKIGENDFSLKSVFTKNARKEAIKTITKVANDKSNLRWLNWKQRNPTLKELRELEQSLKKTNGNIFWLTQNGLSKLNSSIDLLQRVQKKIEELSK